MKQHLVIFDIDGTLTKTNVIDHHCYIQTVQSLIDPNFTHFDADSFTHFTDSAIIVELYQRFLQRDPSEAENLQFQQQYFDSLNAHLQSHPEYFQAIAGAQHIFKALPDHWAIALATGCWRASAQIKLTGGGIDISNSPLATASDAYTRQGIMQYAVDQAKQHYEVSDFEQVVYVGDGLWDLRSCANMQMPFIGIDADNLAYGTGRLGDFHRLANYNDVDYFLKLLSSATPPILTSH